MKDDAKGKVMTHLHYCILLLRFRCKESIPLVHVLFERTFTRTLPLSLSLLKKSVAACTAVAIWIATNARVLLLIGDAFVATSC